MKQKLVSQLFLALLLVIYSASLAAATAQESAGLAGPPPAVRQSAEKLSQAQKIPQPPP